MQRTMSTQFFLRMLCTYLVLLSCGKETIVALSTCEAEYVALATVTQEAKFLRQLLGDLTCVSLVRVFVFC